ncbi:hypothetical protein BVIET440_220019 [Burkholderia vietnamiensis]
MALSRLPARRVRGAARVDTVSATRFGHAPQKPPPPAKRHGSGKTPIRRPRATPRLQPPKWLIILTIQWVQPAV